jgi:hypothetical protein
MEPMFLIFVLMCGCGRLTFRPLLSRGNPSSNGIAVLYRGDGGGATVGFSYVVRFFASPVDTATATKGVEVWSAYSVAPTGLRWLSGDSLLITLEDTSHNRERWANVSSHSTANLVVVTRWDALGVRGPWNTIK